MVKENESDDLSSEFIKSLWFFKKESKKELAQTILNLVRKGVSPNLSLKESRSSHNNETPLMLFAKEGLLDEMKSLIELGANIEIKDSEGKNLLHYAALAKDKSILEYLQKEHHNFFTKHINKEASVYKGLNHTPLALAAEEGKLETVKYLLENGADPLCINNEGESIQDVIYHKLRNNSNSNFSKIFDTIVQYDPFHKAMHLDYSMKSKDITPYKEAELKNKKIQLEKEIKQEILNLGKKIREDRKERLNKLLSGSVFEALDGSKRDNLIKIQTRNKKALNKIR